MKNRFLLVMAAFMTGILMASCDKDDDKVSKPVITITELGLGNNGIAYEGADLHIEAEIVAEGTIRDVLVEIHQEEGSSEEIEARFEEYAGKKNTTFHKHVAIPIGTKLGTYHVHLIVTDQLGYESTAEGEIEIQALNDSEAPVLNLTLTPEDGKVFSNGQTISLAGSVTDNYALGGLLVALVFESDNLTDDQVSGDNPAVVVLLHTHDFESSKLHNFVASIVVGAEFDNNMIPAAIAGQNVWRNGDYFILVKGKDAKGNAFKSARYPIKINR